MAILIGICGPQGSGKTTLLEGIKELYGPDLSLGRQTGILAIDDFKVSRTVQAEHYPGMSLAEITSDPRRAMEFQTRILTAKVDQDIYLTASEVHHTKIHLTERTLVDVAVYNEAWCMNTGASPEFLSLYTAMCETLQKAIYDFTVFVPVGKHAFEHDPNRASDETKFAFEAAAFEMISRTNHVFVITKFDRQERIDELAEFIQAVSKCSGAGSLASQVKKRSDVVKKFTANAAERFNKVKEERKNG